MATTEYVLTSAAAALAIFVAAPVLIAVLAWTYLGHVPRPFRRRLSAPTPARVDDATPAVFHQLELTRLTEVMQRCRSSRSPGAALRFRAACAAYDDRLVQLATTIGLDVPPHEPPLHDDERFDVETRLVAAGAHW